MNYHGVAPPPPLLFGGGGIEAIGILRYQPPKPQPPWIRISMILKKKMGFLSWFFVVEFPSPPPPPDTHTQTHFQKKMLHV